MVLTKFRVASPSSVHPVWKPLTVHSGCSSWESLNPVKLMMKVSDDSYTVYSKPAWDTVRDPLLLFFLITVAATAPVTKIPRRIMAHIHNSSTWEAGAGSIQELHSENLSLTSLSQPHLLPSEPHSYVHKLLF